MNMMLEFRTAMLIACAVLCLLAFANAQISQDPGASRRPVPYVVYESGTTPGDKMQPNDILKVGAYLLSAGSTFKLIMQEDCNVVIYRYSKDATTGAETLGGAIWSTGSNGNGGACIFRLLGRGQVCVLKGMTDSRVPWHSSDTYFNDPLPPFYLILQDDGILAVLYETDLDPAPFTVLWASGSIA